MAPFDVISLLGSVGFFVYAIIGFGFGYILEGSGFGDSRRLASQFYFHDMRVIKVMFTAIVTASILILFFHQMGYLDLQRVWVNPTYLWSAVTGGLIMGVGFIIGGFCPGTSLVAAATLKLDGIFFILGVLLGVGLFGETVGGFESYWNRGSLGRYTLSDFFNFSETQIVTFLFFFALVVYGVVETVEFGISGRKWNMRAWAAQQPKSLKILFFGILVIVGFLVVNGMPSNEEKWSRTNANIKEMLEKSEQLVSPAEVRTAMDNTMMRLRIYDLRTESEFNQFHLRDAQLVTPEQISDRRFFRELRVEPPQSVRILVGNSSGVLEAWKKLVSEGISNVYILDGGIDAWIQEFDKKGPNSELSSLSLGERQPLAYPSMPHGGLKYIKKIKVETKKALKGGCG